MSPRIGFVGLGVMGWPMAQNVKAQGFEITVFDIVPESRDRALVAGFEVAEDLGSLLRGKDVVIAMLPDTPNVEQIVHGPEGILANARQGTVFLDMSTISPLASAEFGARLAEVGIPMIDAPVSGGVQKARSGELSIMAGGDPEVFESVRPVLEAMGTPILMGVMGAGQATKACNQVAVTLTIQAACEAFALGSKLGVDLERLREALLGGSCASWILENLAPQILAGDDEPGFRIALQVKDLRIASDAASRTNTALPGLATVLGLYTEALAYGQADQGNQSLARVYERKTGAVIGRKAVGS